MALSLFLFSCSTAEKKTQEEQKPNLIVIIADDLGWKDVGYHESDTKTPTIDRMSQEGAVFDRFYVHSVCSPTRACLMTGRQPTRFGIYTPLGDEPGLPAGTLTIAGLLKQNGYETAISGKWHLGAVPEARPLNYGFDSSYGYLRGQIDPFTHLYKNGDRTWHRNDSLIDEEGHATDLITAEAIRFIEKPRNAPFFLYVAYSVPHYPLAEPEEWTKPYEGTIENESRRNNAASITHMDHGIGQILSALENKGLDKNTMVFFLSDNGGQRRWSSETEYGGKFKPHDVLGNNLPLRDWKTSLYDGALRVPAVLYWPGKVAPRVIAEFVKVADLYPTLAYLAGVEVSPELNIEGINFWPAVEGGKLPENTIFYWRTNNAIAIKKGDWKLIHKGRDLEKGENELYNIVEDPTEKMDLAAGHPEKVEELLRDMTNEAKKDQPQQRGA